MEAILYQYNPWWEKDLSIKAFPRKIVNEVLLNKLPGPQVVFLTGLRRIGKTTLMMLIIQHLVREKQLNPFKILYVSLDNYLLLNHTVLEIVKQYRIIHKLKSDEYVYLFLDEIAYKQDWEIQLKNLYDLGNCKIIASTSSASLFRSRKALLTGRSVTVEVLPLDFQEYLIFKDIRIQMADHHLKTAYFEDFLRTGGIPQFVLTGDQNYLYSLVDDIIYKDIAAMHSIRNVNLLKDYFLLMIERTGKQVSINKLSRILQISTDTSKRFFELFCDTYLFHPVSRFGKTNQQILSAKKIYSADMGIKNAYSGFRDTGSLFENYVYLNIKQKNPRYVYEDSTEIDFYTDDSILIESKYHDEPLTEKQQLLFERFPAKKKYIIRNFEELDAL
jgi:predicted AAA+ superfamily ATPase